MIFVLVFIFEMLLEDIQCWPDFCFEFTRFYRTAIAGIESTYSMYTQSVAVEVVSGIEAVAIPFTARKITYKWLLVA